MAIFHIDEGAVTLQDAKKRLCGLVGAGVGNRFLLRCTEKTFLIKGILEELWEIKVVGKSLSAVCFLRPK